MSFPQYLTDIFRSRKSGNTPSASTVAKLEAIKAQDAEFRRAMNKDRVNSYVGALSTPIPEDFRAPFNAPQIKPRPAPPSMAPMPTQAAPTQAAPTQSAPPVPGGSAIQRGIAGFLGFVPQGGTRGDAADGWANIGRALMGEESVQKMESDYNQSIAPEKLRRALETGDVEAIKRLDPVVAGQLQGVDDTTYTGDRQRRYDEAVAAGDIEAMRRLDPTKANEFELARRETAMRAANAARVIGGEDPAKVAAVINSFANEQPNLFSPQQLQALEQGGPDALEAMLGAGGLSGKDRFLSVGGGVYDMEIQDWIEPPVVPLTEMDRAEIAHKQAQTRNLDRQNLPEAGAGSGATAAMFSRNLTGILDEIDTLIDRGEAIGAFPSASAGFMGSALARGEKVLADTTANILADPRKLEIWESIESAANSAVPQVRGILEGMGVKIGATQLNTEKEAERFISTVGNPNKTIEAQRSAVDRMRRMYLLDLEIIAGELGITPQEVDAMINSASSSQGATSRAAPAAPSGAGSAYTDAAKEKRYQDWLKSQGR